jgi:hypothetical protein
MDASTDIAPAADVPKVTAGKAKPRPVMFPYQSHCPITPELNKSIDRLARKFCLSKSDIHRMALISYCTSNDIEYVHETQGNANGKA